MSVWWPYLISLMIAFLTSAHGDWTTSCGGSVGGGEGIHYPLPWHAGRPLVPCIWTIRRTPPYMLRVETFDMELYSRGIVVDGQTFSAQNKPDSGIFVGKSVIQIRSESFAGRDMRPRLIIRIGINLVLCI